MLRFFALLGWSVASAWARKPPTHAHLERIRHRVCDACDEIWLKLNPPTGPDSVAAIDAVQAVEMAERCYVALESTCSDCQSLPTGCQRRIEDMEIAIPTVDEPRNLVSSHFSFCRGFNGPLRDSSAYLATEAAGQMSLVAWARVIEWRLSHCTIKILTAPTPIDATCHSLGCHTDCVCRAVLQFALRAKREREVASCRLACSEWHALVSHIHHRLVQCVSPCRVRASAANVRRE